MCGCVRQINVEYIRIFFPPECEESALKLASIFTVFQDDPGWLIQPGDSLQDLLGWGRRPPSEVRALLVWFEDHLRMPKELFSEMETFGDLVNYLADRDGGSDGVHGKPDPGFHWVGMLE